MKACLRTGGFRASLLQTSLLSFLFRRTSSSLWDEFFFSSLHWTFLKEPFLRPTNFFRPFKSCFHLSSIAPWILLPRPSELLFSGYLQVFLHLSQHNFIEIDVHTASDSFSKGGLSRTIQLTLWGWGLHLTNYQLALLPYNKKRQHPMLCLYSVYEELCCVCYPTIWEDWHKVNLLAEDPSNIGYNYNTGWLVDLGNVPSCSILPSSWSRLCQFLWILAGWASEAIMTFCF